jgi:hypothetical protein
MSNVAMGLVVADQGPGVDADPADVLGAESVAGGGAASMGSGAGSGARSMRRKFFSSLGVSGRLVAFDANTD